MPGIASGFAAMMAAKKKGKAAKSAPAKAKKPMPPMKGMKGKAGAAKKMAPPTGGGLDSFY